MEKPKSCSRFQDSWLKMEEFSWVARGKNASYANCKSFQKMIWKSRNAHRYWQDEQQLEKENGSREEQKKLSTKRKADEQISKETERKKIKHDMEATLLKLDSEINKLKHKP